MDDITAEIYGKIGSDAPFYELVERFYAGIEADAAIRPMYPDNLEPGKQHLALFLIQRFGGPQTFSATRGHPRLRMRHVHFRIGPSERDAWVRHMMAAVRNVAEFAPFISELDEYFASAANFLVNVEEPVSVTTNTN